MKPPLTQAEFTARIARLRALTPDEMRDLLIYIDGYAPAAIDDCLQIMKDVVSERRSA